jgi:hypothetical protein
MYLDVLPVVFIWLIVRHCGAQAQALVRVRLTLGLALSSFVGLVVG